VVDEELDEDGLEESVVPALSELGEESVTLLVLPSSANAQFTVISTLIRENTVTNVMTTPSNTPPLCDNDIHDI
jgi:hypothetical protein